MTTVFSAKSIANAFLAQAEKAGKQLTNMQVQKLVFLANGYMLAFHNQPLYYDNTHAWQFGPVIPKLYKALQCFGSGFVTDKIQCEDDVTENDTKAQEIIKAVWTAYGGRTGSQLSTITHKAGSPWSKTWERKKFDVIAVDDIATYYRSLVEAS
jgi:uncharacterized phage-associated protein